MSRSEVRDTVMRKRLGLGRRLRFAFRHHHGRTWAYQGLMCNTHFPHLAPNTAEGFLVGACLLLNWGCKGGWSGKCEPSGLGSRLLLLLLPPLDSGGGKRMKGGCCWPGSVRGTVWSCMLESGGNGSGL
eukprot:1157780-Pelagomonas_calceolata.AAC.21